ncbi:hypothetical protein DFR24_2568 [Panacagrimonas perspica]|uniref:Uncharacterized protein n=1 Tax=Panacagrimonas perspica TaxID=381431 RepID=A0A4R7P376_9GAMM|nr:hypothetical protein [Panacagrimonas perspica]TDU28203.1 hypothetical protein DFR24_2568 [Panacagrimonas perspica]
MDMHLLVPAAMAVAAVGLFFVAWQRFSKPVRLMNGKTRVSPQA